MVIYRLFISDDIHTAYFNHTRKIKHSVVHNTTFLISICSYASRLRFFNLNTQTVQVVCSSSYENAMR